MAGNKVKADKEKIPGYDSQLDIAVSDPNYEAYFKGNIPEPTQYSDGASTILITWFNNFGVRHAKLKSHGNVAYTVRLKKLPAGKRLFVKDNNENIIEITRKSSKDADNVKLKYSDDSGDKIKFTWDVGDPAIGQGP
jgi:hypothetical protein